TYLVATLDDFSRLIPHAEFYWHEKLPHLENTLQKAILKRGIPEILYVDNGQIFSAHQINLICAELGIRKINSKPYHPEGRGKIERFFRTVRDQFLSELSHDKVEHLHQLNNKFWAWLEQQYHQQIHSSNKEAPVNRWRKNVTAFLKKIDEKQLQNIFLWRENRKVNKLGLVSLFGLKFEVASYLHGKNVEIRYNHFNTSEILIYLDGRFIQKAKQAGLTLWNTAAKQKPRQNSKEKITSGIKPLQILEKQHQQHKITQAKKILGQQNAQTPKSSFSKAHFTK
ncbi:DDE-type integrase/transposase/recombinase, partial [Candidatus Saccharibacteria bacterium]|nr:DDE-type integrase/transposase/recombinase [Candidatus Saccharibacteria bacterium]NIS37981.1 DDE-type integrase/transposase/recombinase [Candidatus Saccharibacteria bacterium]NIV03433.1 DDE-type integrase/transposase/recombinase [Calditrichia bacterium]NIV71649.1 DDE-type integrase/transposase/recombinase [Calditrichia bacterium]NIW78731.1 DDE-type integrase/transposase/recombinase [Calditrichia bacterium]